MLNLDVPHGDVLTLAIAVGGDFAQRCPEFYDAILDGAALVSYARIDAGDRPIVAVSAFRDMRRPGSRQAVAVFT